MSKKSGPILYSKLQYKTQKYQYIFFFKYIDETKVDLERKKFCYIFRKVQAMVYGVYDVLNAFFVWKKKAKIKQLQKLTKMLAPAL